MDTELATPPERRQHVRVYDAIALEADTLARSAVDDAVTEFAMTREQFAAPQMLRDTMKAYIDFPQALLRDQPQLVAVLKHLDKKIKCVADTVLNERDLLPSIPTHKVNLSASGICFGSSSPLPQGQFVLLRMKLFPGELRIIAIAETVTCREVDGRSLSGTFSTGAKFVHIDEQDLALLVRHIDHLHRQSAQPGITQAIGC